MQKIKKKKKTTIPGQRLVRFGSHFGTILEPGWPRRLTLGSSGPILAPFEQSSSRSKSVSAKSANPAGQLRSRSAAEGWPLQLKLDSGQLWQGFHTADISKLMRRILMCGALPPTLTGNLDIPASWHQLGCLAAGLAPL